jgi:hypothetical protein
MRTRISSRCSEVQKRDGVKYEVGSKPRLFGLFQFPVGPDHTRQRVLFDLDNSEETKTILRRALLRLLDFAEPRRRSSVSHLKMPQEGPSSSHTASTPFVH